MKVFSLEPAIFRFPVTLYVAPSPSANPSPPTETFLFVRYFPSNSLLSVADVRVTSLLVISRLASATDTLNCFVTSVPAPSFTTAVPVTATS